MELQVATHSDGNDGQYRIVDRDTEGLLDRLERLGEVELSLFEVREWEPSPSSLALLVVSF